MSWWSSIISQDQRDTMEFLHIVEKYGVRLPLSFSNGYTRLLLSGN